MANLTRVILGLPLSLFLTYFVLKKLSLSDYGAWALLVAFFSYFSLIDLGMTTAVTRFISHFKTQNKLKMVNRILNTALVFYLLTGLFLSILLIYLKPSFQNFFFKNNQNVISLVYILVILMAYVDFVFSTFLSVLNGFQRMDVTSTVDLFKTILFTIFAYLCLSWQPTLQSLALAFTFMTLFWAGISFFACRRFFPQLTINFTYFNLSLFKKMLKFGCQSYLASLTILLHFNLDKFLVSHFLGVEKVAFLDIALKLINQSRMVVSSFISPLMPAAAEKTLIFKNKISTFYQNSFKYVFILAALVFGGLITISPLFIRLWLGPGFTMAIIATQILAFGHFINLLTGPASSIILAQGNPKPLFWFSLLEAILNLIFSFSGIIYYGFYGSLVGTSLSLLLTGSIFLFAAPKYFKR